MSIDSEGRSVWSNRSEHWIGLPPASLTSWVPIAVFDASGEPPAVDGRTADPSTIVSDPVFEQPAAQAAASTIIPVPQASVFIAPAPRVSEIASDVPVNRSSLEVW